MWFNLVQWCSCSDGHWSHGQSPSCTHCFSRSLEWRSSHAMATHHATRGEIDDVQLWGYSNLRQSRCLVYLVSCLQVYQFCYNLFILRTLLLQEPGNPWRLREFAVEPKSILLLQGERTQLPQYCTSQEGFKRSEACESAILFLTFEALSWWVKLQAMRIDKFVWAKSNCELQKYDVHQNSSPPTKRVAWQVLDLEMHWVAPVSKLPMHTVEDWYLPGFKHLGVPNAPSFERSHGAAQRFAARTRLECHQRHFWLLRYQLRKQFPQFKGKASPSLQFEDPTWIQHLQHHWIRCHFHPISCISAACARSCREGEGLVGTSLLAPVIQFQHWSRAPNGNTVVGPNLKMKSCEADFKLMNRKDEQCSCILYDYSLINPCKTQGYAAGTLWRCWKTRGLTLVEA